MNVNELKSLPALSRDLQTRAKVDYRQDLIELTVGACYEVSNILGAGFLEKVYERALTQELQSRGLKIETQVAFPVEYKGELVGEYFADILVEKELVVELKCVDALTNIHLAQVINYLKASGKPLALLVNFQKPKVEWRRVVLAL